MEDKNVKKTPGFFKRMFERMTGKAPVLIPEDISEDDFFSGRIESYGAVLFRRFCKNRIAIIGVFIMLVLACSAIFADQLAMYPMDEMHLDKLDNGKPLGPCKEFIWGTDGLGRDFFTRCLYGGRTSLLVGFMSTILCACIGVPLGCIAGYYGGWVDNVICRFLELFNNIPTYFVLMILSTLVEASIWNMIWLIAIFEWPGFVRGIRAYFLQTKTQDFVAAAHNLGLSDRTIIFKHILPYALMPLMYTFINTVISAMSFETTLSFMGLGIREPNTSWGYLMSVAQQYLRRVPILAIIPGLILTACTLGLNFIADGCLDAANPRSGR